MLSTLCGLVSISSSAWAAAAVAPVDDAAAASAAQQSAAQADPLGQSLMARMQFETLHLSLVGVTTFDGQTTCFLKSPGSPKLIHGQVGQSISDYRIVAIDTETAVFERGGIHFTLALGEVHAPEALSADPLQEIVPVVPVSASASGDPLLDPESLVNEESGDEHFAMLEFDDAEFEVDDRDPIDVKSAANLKTRRKAFKTARLIENPWLPVRSKGGERRASSSRAVAAGGSMFILPMKGKLTSGYGYRRHPMGGSRRHHNGMDIAAPYGTRVQAAASGRVIRVSYNGGLGRYVQIRHADGFETVYGHLSRQLVSVGDIVEQGQTIGREGSTGQSTGPHLHFEIRKDGRALNPQSYVRVR